MSLNSLDDYIDQSQSHVISCGVCRLVNVRLGASLVATEDEHGTDFKKTGTYQTVPEHIRNDPREGTRRGWRGHLQYGGW